MTENNELFLDESLNDKPIIEIGRIKFNGSGASVYLPKDIVNALHLKKNGLCRIPLFNINAEGF